MLVYKTIRLTMESRPVREWVSKGEEDGRPLCERATPSNSRKAISWVARPQVV
jgi:hypothetical protein